MTMKADTTVTCSAPAPVVLEADAAVRSIFAHCKDESDPSVINCTWQILLIGAVGVLKQAGCPKAAVACALRLYADQVEKEP